MMFPHAARRRDLARVGAPDQLPLPRFARLSPTAAQLLLARLAATERHDSRALKVLLGGGSDTRSWSRVAAAFRAYEPRAGRHARPRRAVEAEPGVAAVGCCPSGHARAINLRSGAPNRHADSPCAAPPFRGIRSSARSSSSSARPAIARWDACSRAAPAASSRRSSPTRKRCRDRAMERHRLRARLRGRRRRAERRERQDESGQAGEAKRRAESTPRAATAASSPGLCSGSSTVPVRPAAGSCKRSTSHATSRTAPATPSRRVD